MLREADTKLVIGCDLIRDLHFYKIPDNYIRDNPDVQFIMFDPDIPNLDEFALFDVYLGDRITPKMVESMPNLKWIHLTSIGTDKLIGLNRPDIRVTTAKGQLETSVSEHAVSLMFALSRGLKPAIMLQQSSKVSRYEFDKYYKHVVDLGNKCCLVVGLGAIGSKIKSVCESVGMRVLGIRKSITTDKNVYKPDHLKSLVSDADVIFNVLPLNDATRQVFDSSVFRSMKSTSLFINVGRSDTVDQRALVNAIKDGKIKGAALDVFDYGEIQELRSFDNVILTPHIASYSPTYWDRQLKVFSEKLRIYRKNNEDNR